MRPTIFLIGLLVCAAFASSGSLTVRADDDGGDVGEAVNSAEPVNLDVLVDEDVVEVMDDSEAGEEETTVVDVDNEATVSAGAHAPETADAIVTEAETTQSTAQETTKKTVFRSGRYMSYDDYYNGNLDAGTDTLGDPNYNYDPNNRVAPTEPASHRNDGGGFSISPARLLELRSNFLYWFFDQGGNNNNGDYQTDIHASMPQLHKNFNFQLPFFGFRFNYTRISMNGMLEFSDPPEHYTYPLTFPVKEWPRRNDPSFIGIFFSKCRIGQVRQTDTDQRLAGVYFRQERDLMTRTDRFGVEVRERTMWDIREGVVGAETFVPKHVVICTWKNMTFAGGIDVSLYKTNSFQMILATDEVFTYAIFNYIDINWSSHTEAGGDTTGGEGGVPAYIGFNAGNGTQAYEYKPYSQASVLRDLTGRGWANGFPGRHIFRIDERIMLGTCNKDIDAAHLPLVFAPESGNMLGGTLVNITGPCFNAFERVMCRFDTEDVVGIVVDRNRAICVQPRLLAQGYVRFEISIGTEKFKWKGRYFVETPATATEKIFFETDAVFERNPSDIRITWNSFNLTSNRQAMLNIQLFGYDERTIKPNLQMIDTIEANTVNSGVYVISPANFRLRDNVNVTHFQFGFLRIMLNDPQNAVGLQISPQLWSKPIPLGWYFGPQWERIHGRDWPRAQCNNWFNADRNKRDFANNIPVCPCTLEQALNDKGRYMPDFDCDRDGNPTCRHHRGAIHCVKSGLPNVHGAEQQCCYDRVGYLMMSYDQMWGSRPRRNHNIGQVPWNEANKVPTLSTWYNDIIPYYPCCLWAGEQSVGCETYRFERRPTQDCVSYQPPAVAAVFGDPHVMTFDNLQYTFNGKGEFVLVRVQNSEQRFDVQGRFEEVRPNIHGRVMATQLTSIVARGNDSTVVEVRLRPREAQWRYRLDVIADGRRVYFDRPSLKFQHLFGVTVYTPTYILNQSEVVIMFSNGAGVEVIENSGHMTARVYMPWNFINQTRGLFGNWSFDMADDLTLPSGQVVQVNLNNFEALHRDFALNWMLSDREQPGVGGALFHREFGRTASHYANPTFRPNFIREPRDFLPSNRTQDIELATELCGESYQCRFDFGMTLDREMAHFTKNYYDSAVNIRTINEQRTLSCGVLETPRFGRKSNFLFVPGSTVSFECNEGFILMGDPRRTCTSEGRWDPAEYGYTECMRHVFYSRRVAWIAIAIIIIVILPIIMCVVCGIYCYRKKALREDPAWKMSLPRSRSGSRTTLRHLGTNGATDTDGGDSTLKKSRSYDKVYRTHEPLDGKPNVDFPAKKWDLDDEDFTSSDGSEFPAGSTKRTGDIQYLNRADPQRQTGRRGVQQPIEEEDAVVQQHHDDDDDDEDRISEMPSPTAQPKQILPQRLAAYSPTYSGLQRNSSGFESQFGQQPNAVRVLPTAAQSGRSPLQQDDRFFGEGSMSPTSAASPVPQQDVGLPKLLVQQHQQPPQGTKSTEV